MQPTNLIALDSTQMGTQTCAALLGDRATAKLVNMVPSKNKADVYSRVANVMRMRLKSMKTEECPAVKMLYRNHSNEFFHRSVWKRPTMTILYGATYMTYTNHLQEDVKTATGVKLTNEEAKFLGKLTEEVLVEVLPAAVLLMRSLTGIVSTVISTTGQPFIFTTATGAVFKAGKYKNALAKSLGRSAGFDLKIPYETNNLNVKASAKSAAAQFIQSFDAVIAADIQRGMCARGVPVLSVFDSWSVPYGYTQTLLEVAREAYIKHLSNNPLYSFYNESKARYQFLWKQEHSHLFLSRGEYSIEKELPKCSHFIGI